ncbi:MAG: PIN domain-containing protein [Candidatus Methanoperedens sp.]|nr:PIN domain-containing protein [Candidatus Methanoperedens sp.]MCZ7395751.1 PIN domain-containing protein [Candidatus Methanoperedens sp.]
MKHYDLFLDASALVAYFNIEDEFHKQATEIIDAEEINLNLYTCDVTVLELQYVLWKKIDLLTAVDKTLGLIEAEDVTVLNSDIDDILNELEIFKLHPMPSFDAIICAIMNRQGIELIVSFDREHFDAVEGIVRIESLKELKAKIGKK